MYFSSISIRAGFYLVILRLALHAMFLPAFEGPDEPFHLARARAFASVGSTEAWAGMEVDAELVGAMRRAPCGADLHRAVGCPAYGDEPAAFNLLWLGSSEVEVVEPIENYQAHQPPLFYLVSALALTILPVANPFGQLLALRCLALVLVVAGLELCRRSLSTPAFAVLLALFWLPGAAESLIRVANEPLLFFFAALWAWGLTKGRGPAFEAATLAAATLTKLTAAPLVAFSVVRAARAGRWWQSVLFAASGAGVIALQWWRGWAWGGTLELAAEPTASDPILVVLVGLAHSAYTFVKTAIWLGGWAVFRPPALLVVASFAVLAAWAVGVRIVRWPEARLAHLAALLVAAGGFVAFAIGKRDLFGVWGAVGGWYLWAWTPWLAWAGERWLRLRDQRWTRAVSAVTLITLVVLQVAWIVGAIRTYGY